MNPAPPSARPGSDSEKSDATLVADARAGDTDSLDALVRRYQPWIFNLAVRMVWQRQSAEDATQEILIKVVTNLSGFRGESKFSTWVYRIAVNHLLQFRKTLTEQKRETFADFGDSLHKIPDRELADTTLPPADHGLAVEEARHACMMGMLLCLDRRQRVAYILGEVFGVTSVLGGEIMDESSENFRQLLSRARRDLYQFMQERCGLINEVNPCRCARKTFGFVKAGYVNPKDLQFTRERIHTVEEIAPHRLDELVGMARDHARLFRAHNFLTSPDFAGKIRLLIKPFIDHP